MSAAFSPSPAPFIVLIALGLLIWRRGPHRRPAPADRDRHRLIFVATLLLPQALYATE